jgi:hypothetical protein
MPGGGLIVVYFSKGIEEEVERIVSLSYLLGLDGLYGAVPKQNRWNIQENARAVLRGYVLEHKWHRCNSNILVNLGPDWSE